MLTDPLSVMVVSEAVADIVYDPTRDVIWASVPNQNLIAAIDPNTGAFTPAVNLQAKPGPIAISDDGANLYVAQNGIGRIRRVDLNTQTVQEEFLFDPNPVDIVDLEVPPGRPLTVAAGTDNQGITIYDVDVMNGIFVARANTAAGMNLEFDETGNTVYTFDPVTTVDASYFVNAMGFTINPNYGGTVQNGNGDLKYGDGETFFNSGQVVDVFTNALNAQIPLDFPQIPHIPDDQSYFLEGGSPASVHVVAHETFLEIDDVPIINPNTGAVIPVNGTPVDPIRYGTNGLAFRTPTQVFLVTATEFTQQCNTVVISGDAGFGSLREAIECSNATPGIQRIRFDGLGGDPIVIQPLSPLPAITDEVIIDGTTHPGFMATPLVVIDGSKAGNGTDGLTILAGGSKSVIESIAVHSFDGDGLNIRGTDVRVLNSYFGTDDTGATNLGNGENGIRILNSQNNTVMGSVLLGNDEAGVAIEGVTSTGNVVMDNKIGTDVTGTLTRGNRDSGVEISAATGNTIGPDNVISGNKRGVRIRQGATGNVVQSNLIGTDDTGTSSIRNTRGISLEDSDANTIGAGNVISGNTDGVFLLRSNNNIVQGNMMGTNPAGDTAVANTRGVQITSSQDNMITGNVISSNRREGVRITRTDSTGNTIQSNMIGTNLAGDAPLPNRTGIWMTNTAGPNEVGGRMAGEGNTISGNSDVGVQLYSSGHVVEGNLIGTDVNGAVAVPNETGVFVRSAAVNTIGGTASGARNLISGNLEEGVLIAGATAAGNLVQGNYIGTDATGTVALPNKNGVILQGPSNTVGGASAVAGNLISGNTLDGVSLRGADATLNVVLGNRIGVGNGVPNVAPLTEVEPNDTTATARNIDGIGWGLAADANIANATVRPHITVNGTGNDTVDNYSFTVLNAGDVGVFDIDATAGFDSLLTLYDAAGNVVRTNDNSLLTDGAGGSVSTNDSFIQITFTAPGRYVVEVDNVGGAMPGVPTGATYQLQVSVDNHSLVGLPNDRGGVLIEDAPANIIGGTIAGAANVISGNNQQGVKVVGTGSIGNAIQGNFIGVDDTGQGVPNGDGVRVADGAERTMIGGSAAGAGNVIAQNVRRGVFVTANETTAASISRNSIHDNGDLGILLGTVTRTLNDVDDPDTGANNFQNFPVIATAGIVLGTLNITYSVPSTTDNSAYPLTVEFFTTDGAGEEGQTFIHADTYTAPGSKTASFSAGGILGGTQIVATATDANGNSSEFSDPRTIGAPLLAAGGETAGGTAAALSTGQLNGLVGAAIGRLNDVGLSSALFSQVEVTIGDLPGAMLGLAAGNTITIDIDAAGHGWFVDTTPLDDSEFTSSPTHPLTPSPQGMDLLTVVMHELGHTAGLADRYDAGSEDNLMYGWLEAGARRTSLTDSAFDDIGAG